MASLAGVDHVRIDLRQSIRGEVPGVVQVAGGGGRGDVVAELDLALEAGGQHGVAPAPLAADRLGGSHIGRVGVRLYVESSVCTFETTKIYLDVSWLKLGKNSKNYRSDANQSHHSYNLYNFYTLTH